MKMLKIAAKGLAGIALAALLAVNVQVGSGNDILGFGKGSVTKAKAGEYYCLAPYDVDCFKGTTEDGEPVTIVGTRHKKKGPPSPVKN